MRFFLQDQHSPSSGGRQIDLGLVTQLALSSSFQNKLCFCRTSTDSSIQPGGLDCLLSFLRLLSSRGKTNTLELLDLLLRLGIFRSSGPFHLKQNEYGKGRWDNYLSVTHSLLLCSPSTDLGTGDQPKEAFQSRLIFRHTFFERLAQICG